MAKPVYALVGSDAFLQLEALAAIARQLPPDAQRVDIDGETASLSDVLDELRSFAMFGGEKLVVVRNGDDFISRFRESLEDYIASPVNSATLVLRVESLPSNQRIYKAIAKVGTVEQCKPPKDIARWITDRAKAAHKLTVAFDAARMLADLLGDDLGRIDNELAKLALLSDTGKLSADDVSEAVAFQRERKMWDLTNALASGDPAEAMRRWRQLVQADSSSEFRAVTWLGIWLENMRKARAMLAQGQNAYSIGQALKIWPADAAQKFVESTKALGPQGLKRAIDLLAEIDYQSKTGVGDATENVERFILSMSI
jgi:DNA polymerase-3 subunit delta